MLFSHYAGRIKGGWICFPYSLLLGLNPLSILFFHFLPPFLKTWTHIISTDLARWWTMRMTDFLSLCNERQQRLSGLSWRVNGFLFVLSADFMPLDGCLMGLVKGEKAKDITLTSAGKHPISVHLSWTFPNISRMLDRIMGGPPPLSPYSLMSTSNHVCPRLEPTLSPSTMYFTLSLHCSCL